MTRHLTEILHQHDIAPGLVILYVEQPKLVGRNGEPDSRLNAKSPRWGMSQQLPLSYEQMRSLVIQYLAQPTRDSRQLNDLHSGVARLAAEQHGIAPHREGETGIIQLMYGSGVRLTDKDCGWAAIGMSCSCAPPLRS